jgi:acyl carrier protein
MTEPAPAMAETATKEVLAVIGELAHELQPHRRPPLTVRLDSKLDRDLGFDSLARAELLLRLDANLQGSAA